MLDCVANVRDCNDPLFLQLKEAVPSVLEPYSRKSVYLQHGQRVVMGQRLMQPASDLFLGWSTSDAADKQFYVRQLRTPRSSPSLKHSIGRCSWATPRLVDGCSPELTPRLETPPGSAFLGSSDKFDEAVGDFSVAYADQAERDHATLKEAVRQGKVTADRKRDRGEPSAATLWRRFSPLPVGQVQQLGSLPDDQSPCLQS